MLRKLLSGKTACILAVILTLFMSAGVAEEERKSGNWKYVMEGDGVTITGFVKEPGGDLTIPDKLGKIVVTGIGEDAFTDCESITIVTIPNCVTNIGRNPFAGCPIICFNVADDNPVYCQIDGVLFNKEYSMLTSCPGAREGVYIIPEGTFRIDNAAFACCALTGVVIPDSVNWIADGAFALCKSLTSVTIPDSVTTIRPRLFLGCVSLSDIAIPDSVTDIHMDAFKRCTGLTSLTIPDSVVYIANWAFYDCSGLSGMTIPSSVEYIGGDAFYGCNNLVLTVEEGSCAEQYAKENGIPFAYTAE
jgi:hypothetical protein